VVVVDAAEQRQTTRATKSKSAPDLTQQSRVAPFATLHDAEAMVAQTRHSGQPSPKKKLAFHEKLGGKGLSTDALLKKLKTLHTQLAALDQDTVDVASLGTARKELINTSILLHKDRGVKAFAACCLADILRLYAPDAPYTQAELRDIFQFFFRQLSNGLKGPESSYYTEYFHLLESLSTVKSVVLVCDLPSADELMAEIFRDFFALVRRDLAKKVELFLADILVALIDESQALPSEALDILMAQFIDKNAVGILHFIFSIVQLTLSLLAGHRTSGLSLGSPSLQLHC
jgi:sister-chromatid-cohesion protein PDS5